MGDSEIPKEMEEQKANVYKTLEDLEQGCKALHDLCGNEDEKMKLVAGKKWSVVALAQIPQYNVTPEVVETYRQHAKFKFDCGDYQASRNMLANYISLFA